MEMEVLKISVAGSAGSGKTYVMSILADELERNGYKIVNGKDVAFKPTPFEEEIVITYTK